MMCPSQWNGYVIRPKELIHWIMLRKRKLIEYMTGFSGYKGEQLDEKLSPPASSVTSDF